MSALEARNVQYSVNTLPAVRDYPAQAPKTQNKTKAQAKPSLNLLPVMAVFAVTFVMLFGVLFMQGKIQANNIAISKLKAEIAQVEEANEELRLKIVMADDVSAVANKLQEDPDYYGMRAPSALEPDLGIAEMLEAFASMPEYDLWICGHGSMKAAVEKAAADCPNIRYFGFVPQEKALDLQSRASALINPRQASGLFTRYSFPSKTLEYMRSGKPVLCCPLEGIPSDYAPYLHYMKPGSQGIEEAVRLLMVLPADERRKMGENARTYVTENKNPKTQCKKLLQLLGRL